MDWTKCERKKKLMLRKFELGREIQWTGEQGNSSKMQSKVMPRTTRDLLYFCR